MSASSSTTRSPGRAGVSGLVTDAFHEGALEAVLAVTRAKRLRRAAKPQPRALEHRDRRAQLVDLSQYMGSEEQRAALRAQALQHRFHRYPRRRVKAAHRLVEHVELALQHETARPAELLRHAFRQAAYPALQRIALELELRRHAHGAGLVLVRSREAGQPAHE